MLPQLEQEQPPEQELQQQALEQLLELEPQQALVLQRLVQKVQERHLLELREPSRIHLLALKRCLEEQEELLQRELVVRLVLLVLPELLDWAALEVWVECSTQVYSACFKEEDLEVLVGWEEWAVWVAWAEWAEWEVLALDLVAWGEWELERRQHRPKSRVSSMRSSFSR